MCILYLPTTTIIAACLDVSFSCEAHIIIIIITIGYVYILAMASVVRLVCHLGAIDGECVYVIIYYMVIVLLLKLKHIKISFARVCVCA